MDQVKIGSLLKELRNEHSLSQEQLAEKFNVSSRSVSRWENGNTMPDISIISEIADFYEIDIRELIDGERKNEPVPEEETVSKIIEYADGRRLYRGRKSQNLKEGLYLRTGRDNHFSSRIDRVFSQLCGKDRHCSYTVSFDPGKRHLRN